MEPSSNANASVCSDSNSVSGTASLSNNPAMNNSFTRDRSLDSNQAMAPGTAASVAESPARRKPTTVPMAGASPHVNAASAPPTPNSVKQQPPSHRQPPQQPPQNLDDIFQMQVVQQQQQLQQPQLPPQLPPPTNITNRPRSVQPQDDDHTELSSMNDASASGGNNNSNRAAARGGYTRTDLDATSTFGRAVQNSTNQRKRFASSDRNRSTSADEDDLFEGALIYGYLQKLGRNGKWQTRWFETDGECLTYYKSSKRSKVLATLDISKVGSIVVDHGDPKGESFIIHISDRPYFLRADSKAACKDWVITLNRVKEARMHQGNVKLVHPGEDAGGGVLDFLDSNNRTPRVVVVANRQRTRAVDEESMLEDWETGAMENDPANYYGSTTAAGSGAKQRVKWQKPRSSFKQLASKVLRWARSLKELTCKDAENQVVLDHHVHPPGHDDKPKRSHKSQLSSPVGSHSSGNKTGADIIGASHSISTKDSGVGASASQDFEEEEARMLS